MQEALMLARGVALLSIVVLSAAQEPEDLVQVDPDDPLHHFATLDVGPEDTTVEWFFESEATLHVWARSDVVDPVLHVSGQEGSVLRDESSGGGTTAYVRLHVDAGADVLITTSAAVAGSAEVHWIAAHESEATHRAVDVMSGLLQEIQVAEREGDRQRARELATDAVDSLRDLNPAEFNSVLDDMAWDLGFTAHRLGLLEICSRCLRVVLAARERTLPEDHPDLLRARQNLANTLHLQGDLAGARALMESLVASRERALPENHPSLHATRLNLAGTMFAQGDLQAARELSESVLTGFEATLPDDHAYLLAAREALALTLHELGDLAGARALSESVLEARERTLPENDPALLPTREGLALTMKAQGDLDGARDLEEAVVWAHESTLAVQDHPHLLRARLNLAATMMEQGDLADARQLFDAVLEGFERTRPEDHPDLLDARLNVAVAMYLQGELAAAGVQAQRLAAGTLVGLERAAATLSRREAAEVVSASARWHSMARFLSSSDETGSFDFDLAETLRSVASLDIVAHSRSTPAIESHRRDLAALRGRIGDLAAAPVTPGTEEELSATMQTLSAERDEIERTLRRELDVRGVSTGAIRAQEVARALPEGVAALAFVRTQGWRLDEDSHRVTSRGDVLTAHLLEPGGELSEVELGAADDLELLLAAWRAEIGEPIGRGIGVGVEAGGDETEAGERLRETLLDPLLAGLDDEVTTLYVCVADLVHAVPLEALPLGEGRLGDRYRVVNLVSFRTLLTEREPLDPDAPLELLAIGDVAFDSEAEAEPVDALSATIEGAVRGGLTHRLERLPGTALELAALSTAFEEAFGRKATTLSGEAATKAAFHRLAPGKRFVHAGTHGWFAEMQFPEQEDGEPLAPGWGLGERARAFTPWSYCGLALAGANRGRDSLGRVPGIMTAEELAGIDLSACELAVLSACETNVGIRSAGLGMESLQAALHASGARTAVTSLWRVDDAATRELMELFYNYLWVEKRSKADALWKAKCELREAGHPVKHWAAWVLSGDPN